MRSLFRSRIPRSACSSIASSLGCLPIGKVVLERRLAYHELSYAQTGEPSEVLEYHKKDGQETAVKGDQEGCVQVEMLHVPWNPADMNVVQGRYASPYAGQNLLSPPNTASSMFQGRTVAGSEGLGRVVKSDSKTLPVGTLVTVGLPGLGTMRSSLWASESSLLRVPDQILDEKGPAGASLFQLGGTALRMLADFVDLEPGEVVVQNAGNSSVSLMTSQLATAMFGVSAVSMVRRGHKSMSEMEEMIDHLTTMGKNAMVMVEEDLEDKDYRKSVESKLRDLSVNGGLPRLAMNSVGGESSNSLLKLLNSGGTMVTYGGMSGKPITIGTPLLIFKDLRARGYWHSRYLVQNNVPVKQKMVDDLSDAALNKGVVCVPNKVFRMEEVKEALRWQANQTGGIRKKLVFDCQQ